MKAQLSDGLFCFLGASYLVQLWLFTPSFPRPVSFEMTTCHLTAQLSVFQVLFLFIAFSQGLPDHDGPIILNGPDTRGKGARLA